MRWKQAKKWLEENLDRLMWELGISQWRIEIKPADLPNTPEDGMVMARVEHLAPRERALIEIDPRHIRDEKALEQTIEHELLHLHLASYDFVMQVARKSLSEEQYAVLEEVYDYAAEQAVRSLERLVLRLRPKEKTDGDNS